MSWEYPNINPYGHMKQLSSRHPSLVSELEIPAFPIDSGMLSTTFCWSHHLSSAEKMAGRPRKWAPYVPAPMMGSCEIRHETTTGWRYTYPSEKYEFVSWDDDIPNNYMEKWKMFQTTNQTTTINYPKLMLIPQGGAPFVQKNAASSCRAVDFLVPEIDPALAGTTRNQLL